MTENYQKIKLNSETIKTKLDELLDEVERADMRTGTDDDWEIDLMQDFLRQALADTNDVQTCINHIRETLDDMYRKAGV